MAVAASGSEQQDLQPADSRVRPQNVGPPRSGSFVKLREPDTRLAPCRRCGGEGHVRCGCCGGSGRLGRGGYQKRNPVNVNRLIGEEFSLSDLGIGR